MPAKMILAARVEDHKLVVVQKAVPDDTIQKARLPRNTSAILF
jgi:hypothetical protein